MNRINVFKTPAVFLKFFLAFGSVFFVLGTGIFIKALSAGFDTRFPSGDWSSVIFILQGILFFIMGTMALMNRKYFIEWDDSGLRFLLPDTKKIEVIEFKDIISFRIKLFEIELTLHDGIRTLDLNNLQFEDLKKIKKMFEALYQDISKGDSAGNNTC